MWHLDLENDTAPLRSLFELPFRLNEVDILCIYTQCYIIKYSIFDISQTLGGSNSVNNDIQEQYRKSSYCLFFILFLDNARGHYILFSLFGKVYYFIPV